jgi:hypothetical protein
VKVGQRIVEVVFKGVDQTSGAFGDMQKKLGQMGKDVPLLGAAFDLLKNPITLITSAVVGLATAIKKAGDNSIRLGASFQDLANRTDMSVESLARWKFIAEQNGSSIDEFEQAFRKLRNTMADAASNNQAAIDVFARLGVKATDVNGNMRDLETVLLEIGQAVREHGAASIEGAAAQDALGRSSAGVVAIIKQQSDALRAQISEASAYSSNMTSAWAASADAADDAMAKFRTARENANAGSTKWWATFRKDWAEGWSDFILYNTNNSGWEQLRKLEEDAAKAASHAVAASYIEGLIGGIKNGASESNVAALAESAVFDAARSLHIQTTGPVFDASTLTFIDKPKLVNKLQEEITAALTELRDMKAPGASAMATQDIELRFVGPDGKELNATNMLPKIDTDQSHLVALAEQAIRAASAFRDLAGEGNDLEGQLDGMRAVIDSLSEVMDPDARAEVIAYYKAMRDGIKQMAAEEDTLKDIGLGLKDGLEEIGVTAVDAFLNGEAGAMKFGDMIRRTITRAIAEAIVKMLVLKAISAISNGIIGAKDGGRPVPARAFGGRIPGFAAGGYAVPDGPRGMDSRMIMAMPGEEVINRQLSMRMDRMVTAFEQGAAVSPFALSGAGGGRSTVINFNVARPVNVLDALSLGRDAVTASRKYSEAVL